MLPACPLLGVLGQHPLGMQCPLAALILISHGFCGKVRMNLNPLHNVVAFEAQVP